MCKKLVSAWLALALIFAFIPPFAGASSPFSDAPWGGQTADPGTDDSPDERFAFDDFDIGQPTLPPSSPDNQTIEELVYRDGIKFGMTIDQVKGLEKNSPAEEHWQKNYSMQDTYYLKYTGEKTLDISCDIEYHFTGSNGTLIIIIARLEIPSALSYDSIIKREDQYIEIDNALAEKYGPSDGPSSYDYSGLDGLEEATVWSAKRGKNYSIKHGFSTSSYGSNHYITYSYEDFGERGGV